MNENLKHTKEATFVCVCVLTRQQQAVIDDSKLVVAFDLAVAQPHGNFVLGKPPNIAALVVQVISVTKNSHLEPKRGQMIQSLQIISGCFITLMPAAAMSMILSAMASRVMV